MVVLYLVSNEPSAGKSMIALALGLRLQEEGTVVGYFRPVGLHPTRRDELLVDEDAAFIADTLHLPDALADISPLVLTPELVEQVLAGGAPDLRGAVQAAFARIRQGKQVLLVEGAGAVTVTGWMVGLPAPVVAGMLGARSLLVGRYQGEASVDSVLVSARMMGEGVIGVILNVVPPNQMSFVQEQVQPYLQAQGLEVLGVLPRDSVLGAVSVRELARQLGARVLCCEDRLDELVEHFSVGAMTVESALRYFRRTPRKAVITGGDRSDIQLAALDTDTRCLVLTGDLYPNSLILSRAEEAGVPMLLVSMDTLSAIEKVEALLGGLGVREPRKVARARELLDRYVNYGRIMELLGPT